MTGKLFTVILRNRFDAWRNGVKPFSNGCAHLLGCLTINLSHHCKTAFSFNQGHNGMLVCRSYDGIAFPVTDAGAKVYRCGAHGNRASIRNMSAAVVAAGIAFTPLFLAAQGEP